MKYLKIFSILLVLLLVSTLASMANIGVQDSGKAGTAKITVADLGVRSTQTGWAEDYFDMVPNDTSYSVYVNAHTVTFLFKVRFTTQQITSQRFTAGARIYKVESDGSLTQLWKQDRHVDLTLKGNETKTADFSVPILWRDLTNSNTVKLKIMTLYDIYGKHNGSKTRTFTIDRDLED